MIYLSSSIWMILSKGSLNSAPNANAVMGTADPDFFVLYPHLSPDRSHLQVFSSAFVVACFLVYPAVFSWIQRPEALWSSRLFSWSVEDLICLKAVTVSIPQDSSWYFSFKLPKPWQLLVIVSKEVEVVGLKNISVWCDSHSPSEIIFLLLDCVPDSFFFLLLSSWQMLQATGRLSPFYIVICFPVWKHHHLCWEQDVCLSLSASCSIRLIDLYIFLSRLGWPSHTQRGLLGAQLRSVTKMYF